MQAERGKGGLCPGAYVRSPIAIPRKSLHTIALVRLSLTLGIGTIDAQFGFKKQHSTADCTFVLKRTVEYYRRNGSHVFAGFIDFNKAFDSVDYWLLFL